MVPYRDSVPTEDLAFEARESNPRYFTVRMPFVKCCGPVAFGFTFRPKQVNTGEFAAWGTVQPIQALYASRLRRPDGRLHSTK
jgi:hypothetical protein